MKIVWNNTFDQNRDNCSETCEGNSIDLIPYGTKIGFRSHIPTESELRKLPHIGLKYGSEWNTIQSNLVRYLQTMIAMHFIHNNIPFVFILQRR